MKYLFFCICLFSLNICPNAQAVKKIAAVQTQTLQINFENKVGAAPLEFETDYKNADSETFNVRSFKYYISNIEIQFTEGGYKPINLPPHLVNEADSLSKVIYIAIPAGYIKSIRFLLGVDRMYNISGTQTGDLDPAKGMFWVWNTGYIMAKLEGTSPQAKTPGKQFTYDIGGYKNDENAARQIELQVPPSTASSLNTFTITADILKWFTGAQNISIAAQPMCHSPGKLAMQIADNYASMFSIK